MFLAFCRLTQLTSPSSTLRCRDDIVGKTSTIRYTEYKLRDQQSCQLVQTGLVNAAMHQAAVEQRFPTYFSCTVLYSTDLPRRLKTCSGISSSPLEVRFSDPVALACLKSFSREAAPVADETLTSKPDDRRPPPRPLLAARIACTTLLDSLPPKPLRPDPLLDDAIRSLWPVTSLKRKPLRERALNAEGR